MSNINTTINTASTTHLGKEYYDRKLLETAKTRLVHACYGQKRSIPPHSGKRVEFRRYELFTPDTDKLTLAEGVTPDGQSLAQSHVEAEVKQYGAYIEVSDLLDATGFDTVINDGAELLGEQLGTVIEWVTRDAMCAGTNVQYAGGRVNRAALTGSDVLTVSEVRKAVRTLKKNKAKMFGDNGRKPHFICICSPEATYDLQDDPLWQDVSKYSNAESIYSGEIGRMFSVVFVESTEAMVYAAGGAATSADSGAPKYDVHAALVFGKDAYGTIKLEGRGNMETIIKPLGSGGTGDPLNQRCTVAAKVNGYTAKILNNAWLVRIEHGITA